MPASQAAALAASSTAAARAGPQDQRADCVHLGRYRRDSRTRELVMLTDQSGGRLVVDREAFGHSDARLLAELAPEEPPENAALIARLYRATPRPCRLISAARQAAPHADPAGDLPDSVTGPDGLAYRLAAVGDDEEVRWVAGDRNSAPGRQNVRTVREVVGALQTYDPVFAMTEAAIQSAPPGKRAALTRELAAVRNSSRVLNRGLREAVLEHVERGVSYSEIAVRCGHVRNDRRGLTCGETSWLRRRIGLIPEAGKQQPTPWIRADVLALIARQGLGIAPRDVELH